MNKDNIKRILKRNEIVTFWNNPKEDSYCLSNWYPSKFNVKEVTYEHMEQFMMYQKALLFNDIDIAKKILNAKTPKECKRLGRQVKNFNENTWNDKKDKIVFTGCYEKVIQNKDIQKYLLSTKDKILIEASPFDSIWGVKLKAENDDILNVDKWQGENLLGFIFMNIRTLIHLGKLSGR